MNRILNVNKKKISIDNIMQIGKYFLLTYSFLLFAYNFINNFEMTVLISNFTAYTVLFLSFYYLFLSKNNWLLLVMFGSIFYFNYSIIIANYLFVIDDSLFTSFSYDFVANIGLNIILFFLIIVGFFFPTKILNRMSEKNIFINIQNRNDLIILIISIILIIILIFGFGRPNVIGHRGSPSQIYEYSLIFFIIGFYYSGKKRKNILLLLLILFLFSLQNFIYGGRVTGLQLAVSGFLMLYAYRVNVKKTLPIIIIAFIFLSIIGTFRAEFNLNLQTIKIIINKIFEKKFTLDTAYAAYYASLTFIKVENFISMDVRIEMLKKFILSMFIGASKVKNSSLAEYTKNYYIHYNGGILPFHFHFYLGWFGVFLSGSLLSTYVYFLNGLNENSTGLIKCIAIYICSSVFRWYLYSPSDLIRGVMLLSFVYLFFYMIDIASKKILLNH